jgi:hypothetical protein
MRSPHHPAVAYLYLVRCLSAHALLLFDCFQQTALPVGFALTCQPVLEQHRTL